MRCSRCHCENIPGQDRCFKCGSILEAAGGLVEVHPPRMSAWRGPFRGIARRLRRFQILSGTLPSDRIRRLLDRLASDAAFGLIVSVIPGLAHLIRGRFREVRLYVLLWLVLLSMGLFLYSSGVGYLLIGLAIGVHAWIAIQFALLKEISGLAERMAATLVVVGCFALLYWGVPRLAFRGYTGGYTALTIPDMQIHRGDYLLVRRTRPSQVVLTRGTLVLFHPIYIGNNQVDTVRDRQPMIGQIVGLPGETITIAEGCYAVGDDRLDPERFPVPRWLPDRTITTVVHPGLYFVSSAYTLQAHGNIRLTDAAVRRVCLVRMEDIQGHAFMRWWPLTRRGFIE